MGDGAANIFTERRKLYEYTMLRELPAFFQEIEAKADSFLYIAARERRGFNLAFLYLSHLKNLLSSSGLLLHYRELARYCEEYGEFPKLLILDDLTLHGRGVHNYLWELKQLVFKELKNNSDTEYTFSRFENMFSRAVEIYVYAESPNTGFLNKEVARFSAYKQNVPWPQIHSLSMQLSDALVRWEIANTSFVFSARCEDLYELIVKKGQRHRRRWQGVEWNCGGESSLLFFRFSGGDFVNYVSTIRTFPRRNKEATPQITSFTFIGDLSESVMRAAFFRLMQIFHDNGLFTLAGILSDTNPGILNCQGQLLDYCISVVDFFDFCDDLLDGQDKEAVLGDLRGDIRKISCNFGGGMDIFLELSKITFNAEIRDQIAEVRSFLQGCAGKLISIPAASCSFSQEPTGEDIDFYNDKVADIFFRVGFRDECHVARLSDRPYLFAEWDYQSYAAEMPDAYGKDGVISVRDFWYLLETDPQVILSGDTVCGFTAAYLLSIDYGVMGNRMRYLRDERKKLTMLAKAGELSAFQVPKKLSLYLPALAKVERFYYYAAPTRELAISRFLKYLSESESFAEDFPKEKRDKIQAGVKELYECGHNCGQWDFVNLTHQCDVKNQRKQNELRKKADQFLHLS